MRAGHGVTLAAGTSLYHVHRDGRSALDFNPHKVGGRWRFSPIRNAAGPIPDWNAALTPRGAICEAIFRDLVMKRQRAIFRAVSLAGRVISEVRLTRPLELLQLHGPGLLALRLPTTLTACDPRLYRRTTAIGQALYKACDDVAGFIWRSRIDNDELAIVLYGPRTSAGFATAGDPLSLNEGLGLATVMEAASLVGCVVI